MAITRLRNGKQLEQSSLPGSVMVSDSSNEALWFSPVTGSDKILFYDDSAVAVAWLNIGTNLSISGTTINASAGAGGYATVQEEGSTVGAGNTTLNFVGGGYTATDAGGGVTNVTLDGDLNAVAALSGTGLAARTASNTWTTRTITGTSGRLSVSNGDGVSGNPTLDIDSNVAFKNANETISGNWTFSNNVVLNGTPSLDSHAVNLGTLKTYINGLDPKGSVRAATTTAGTLASSFANGSVIDGVTLVTGDRILIKDQAAPAENGIYTVNASGAPTRAVDMDSWTEVPGAYVAVEEGTANGDTVWLCTSDQGGTLGTTSIVWSKWKSQGAGIDGSGAANKVAYWSDTDTLTYDTLFHYASGQLAVGTATPASSSVFTTKGTGTSTSTFGWTHQNSSGTNVFSVMDSGQINIGASSAMTITNSTLTTTGVISMNLTSAASINSTVAGSGAQFTIAGGGATASVGLFSLNGTTKTSNSTNQKFAEFLGTFAPTASGTNTFAEVLIQPTINQTGGHTGATYGIQVEPVLTAASNFAAYYANVSTSHYSLFLNAGKVKWNLGSDATGDMYYRNSTGDIARLAIGSSSQVLYGGTTPSFGAIVVPKDECFIEGQTGTTFDLDANTGVVKDRSGSNKSFTVPSNLILLHVYRNGQLIYPDGSGGTPSRDYSVNTSTHVLTVNSALTSGESLYITKFA